MQHLVIDGAIFRLQKSGGISRVWAETLLGLESSFARENRVTLLMPRNQNVEWQAIEHMLPHIEVRRRRSFRGSLARDSLYLTKQALQLRPQVWHASYYVGFPKAFCRKKIATFYDMIPEKIGGADPRETACKRKALSYADTILAISASSKHDLTAFWPDLAPKTRLLPLCSTVTANATQPKPYFLYVGRRGGYKNFKAVTEALLSDPRFASYDIHIVGGEEAPPSHPRMISRGLLSFEEVQRELAGASALLFPSLYEGFGLPVLEAFQMGVPVVACRTSSIPEIVGDDYPLANPQEPRTFGPVLADLLSDLPRWIAYGKKRASLYTREKMIAALLDVYHAV